jgi:hypothetical protein
MRIAILLAACTALFRPTFADDAPAPAAAPAPAIEPAPAPGCTKDVDCKGDRICDAGVCRAPAAAADVCAKDTDCPGDQICVAAACKANVSTFAPSPPIVTRPMTTIVAPTVATTTPSPIPGVVVEEETTAAPKPMKEGFASKFGVMVGGVLSSIEQPGFPESSDSDSTFLESGAIGGYLGGGFALLLVEHYALVDGASFGVIGPGVKFGGSERGSWSLQTAMGYGNVSFDGGESFGGFGIAVDLFLPFGRSGFGLNLAQSAEFFEIGTAKLTLAAFAAGIAYER